MKLVKIISPTMQKAMAKVEDVYGENALIYSTTETENGIEVVVGVEEPTIEAEVKIEAIQPKGSKQPDLSLMRKLAKKLDSVEANISKFKEHFITTMQKEKPGKTTKKIKLLNELQESGFTGEFCEEIASDLVKHYKPTQGLTITELQTSVLKKIKATPLIEEGQNVIALVGPTGVGKTTTIAKIAKHYLPIFGPDKIGFISTDPHDRITKQHISHYSENYKVDLKYATNGKQLSSIIQQMKHKTLILIDTSGYGQRDAKQISELVDCLNMRGDIIKTYLTMPCSLQTKNYAAIISAFKDCLLHGLILTKFDECESIAPVICTTQEYYLPISVVGCGQEIGKDLFELDEKGILRFINSEVVTIPPQTEVDNAANEGIKCGA